MSKILLVEDDESLALGIEFTLKDEGYLVQVAKTLAESRKLFYTENFDLILLDVNLPDGSGYEFCKEIRNESEIPIIFLTALDDEVNIVLGLEIGGDDYITKPFRVRELLSRIKVAIRRNNKSKSMGSKLISGDICVDIDIALVKKLGKKLVLTAQEYKLLLVFMNKPNLLMKRDKLLTELIQSEDIFFDENTIAVYIKRIREKIEDNIKQPEYIVNKRGFGYKWAKEVIKE